MITVNEGPLGSRVVNESRVNGAMVIGLLPLGILLFFFFFNRECISGRWGKLSFPTQYES